MEKKVWNSLTSVGREKKYEVNKLPSKTVPDQTMSMREIFERHVRGLPIEGVRVPVYDENDDMPDPRTLDLADRQRIAEEAREEIAEIKKRHEQNKYPKKTRGSGQSPVHENESAQPTKNGGSEADASKSQGAAAPGNATDTGASGKK